MARITIRIPEKFNFSTEMEVRVTDLNYGNHLSNDKILSIAHEARIRFLKTLGYKDELNIEGLGFILTDAAVTYHSESFLHDQLIINLGITDISRAGFDIIYQITNKETGVSVANAKTGIVFFDYQTKKVKSIPLIFLEKINGI